MSSGDGMDGTNVAPPFQFWQDRSAALTLKRQGRELVGPCPACGGTDRFAVKPVNGGAAVIHCRQCKGFVDILKAAGCAEQRPTNGADPTREFQYRDLSGDHYHSAFRQGDGPDKKCWQRAGFKGRPLPYRIEHLADFGDRPVVIAEGEPKADRLAQLGYAAVAWCGGAEAVLRTRWVALSGFDVILWPDADPPGVKAMERLSEALQGNGCAVRWVAVPDGKPKGWDCMDARRGGRSPADRGRRGFRRLPRGGTRRRNRCADDARISRHGFDPPRIRGRRAVHGGGSERDWRQTRHRQKHD